MRPSRFRQTDGATISRGVNARDANNVARADAHAARAFVRGESRQELHDLSIDIQRDQPLAIRVEAHHRSSIVLDRTLQRQSGRGLEAEEHAPERTDEQPLEGGRREESNTSTPRLAERRGDETARAEADEQREENAWREQGHDPSRAVPAGMVSVTGVHRVSMSSVSVPGVSVCAVRMSTVRMSAVRVTLSTVSAVPEVG